MNNYYTTTKRSRFHRLTLGVATLISIAVFAGCTPEQLTVLEQHTGTLSPEIRQILIDMPDDVLVISGIDVYPDGVQVERSAPSGSRCPQHYRTAMNAGWSHSQWSKIDFIIWRESRCKSNAYNGKGRDNSYGLMQLNMKAHKSWVGPMVNWDFTQLYNPSTNLRIAKHLYDKARKTFGCGFQPWKTTKQRHWCN